MHTHIPLSKSIHLRKQLIVQCAFASLHSKQASRSAYISPCVGVRLNVSIPAFDMLSHTAEEYWRFALHAFRKCRLLKSITGLKEVWA